MARNLDRVDFQSVPDFVKHVLSRYKELLDELEAWDFKRDPLEYPPDDERRNLEETTTAIEEFPGDWLPGSRQSYLKKHGRVLCRATAWYVSELTRQLGEEWVAIDNRLKEIGLLDKSFSTKRPVDVEPNLERQLRAEIEIGSKLAREFCAPWIPRLPSGEIDSVKWRTQALEEWRIRHKGSRDEKLG